jgi:hypothetical protein
MKTSRTFFQVVCAALSGCVAAGAAQPGDAIVPDRVIKLSNGKDLSGWVTWLVDAKGEDPRSVYSVQDGAIRLAGDGFGYLGTKERRGKRSLWEASTPAGGEDVSE